MSLFTPQGCGLLCHYAPPCQTFLGLLRAGVFAERLTRPPPCPRPFQVFLRETERQRLQDLLHQEVHRRIVALQRRFRALLERRHFVSMRLAACAIQVSRRLTDGQLRPVVSVAVVAAVSGRALSNGQLSRGGSRPLLPLPGTYQPHRFTDSFADWQLSLCCPVSLWASDVYRLIFTLILSSFSRFSLFSSVQCLDAARRKLRPVKHSLVFPLCFSDVLSGARALFV